MRDVRATAGGALKVWTTGADLSPITDSGSLSRAFTMVIQGCAEIHDGFVY